MKSSSIKGFTFIELIVVTVVIALFATLSFSTMNRFTNEKQLQNETKKIINVLELAKSKANAGDRSLCGSDAFVTPKVLDFTFQVDSESSYKITPNCLDGSIPTPIYYSNTSGLTFKSNIYPFSLTFPANYGEVTCTCLIVKSDILTKCRYIKVSKNTVINEGSCSDCTCTNCSCP